MIVTYIIVQVREELSSFWPILKDELPRKLISKQAPPIQVIYFRFLLKSSHLYLVCLGVICKFG